MSCGGAFHQSNITGGNREKMHKQALRNKEDTTHPYLGCRSRPPRTCSLFRIRSAKASSDTVEKRSKISTVVELVSKSNMP